MSAEVFNSDATPAVSLSFVLRALHARRRTIGAFALSFLVLGILVALLLKNKYTAVGTVLPPQESSSGLSQLAGLAGGGAALSLGLGGHSSGEMYVQLLQSRSVADTLIAQFHLNQVYKTKLVSMTRTALAANSKIVLNEKSNIISIAVTDLSPQRAADMVNGYVSAYQKMSARLAVTQAERRRVFFDRQLFDAKNNLAKAEENLASTQKQTGLLQPESQTQALISSAANLRAQVAAKQVEVEGMRNYATEENPQMEQAQRELAGLKEQLSTLEHSQGLDPNALIMSKNAMQNGGIEYIRRLRDVKYYEVIYEMLARQLETARLEEAREGNGIEVVDVAIPPDRKSGPKRSLIALGFLLFGFVAGCCWVLGRMGLEDFRVRARSSERALSASQVAVHS